MVSISIRPPVPELSWLGSSDLLIVIRLTESASRFDRSADRPTPFPTGRFTPFSLIAFMSGSSPRTITLVPSPVTELRWNETPGARRSASEKVVPVKLPRSSAEITSALFSAVRCRFSALARALRDPKTTTSSTVPTAASFRTKLCSRVPPAGMFTVSMTGSYPRNEISTVWAPAGSEEKRKLPKPSTLVVWPVSMRRTSAPSNPRAPVETDTRPTSAPCPAVCPEAGPLTMNEPPSVTPSRNPEPRNRAS